MKIFSLLRWHNLLYHSSSSSFCSSYWMKLFLFSSQIITREREREERRKARQEERDKENEERKEKQQQREKEREKEKRDRESERQRSRSPRNRRRSRSRSRSPRGPRRRWNMAGRTELFIVLDILFCFVRAIFKGIYPFPSLNALFCSVIAVWQLDLESSQDMFSPLCRCSKH